MGCISGCGKCCSYATIEASPLEFLPWAFHLFINNEAEKTLDILNNTNSTTCFIYKPLTFRDKGKCNSYKYRGLICRLFGFAASSDKYGALRLATCKIIKEDQQEAYKATNEAIKNGLHIPVFTNYYMQLSQIDSFLGRKIVPVNQALKIAIEEILHYYAYRPNPGLVKNCG